jgi:hypothetical protein
VGGPSTPELRVLEAVEQEVGIQHDLLLAAYYVLFAIERKHMLQGRLVQNPNFNVGPTIHGLFDPDGAGDNTDYKVNFAVSVNKELRDELKNVHVQIVGTRGTDVLSHISSVMDPSTKKKDGSFTVGKTLFIYGQRIRIEGNPQVNPDTIESGIGVFFVPPTGAAVQVPVLGIYQNEPSFVQVEVPSTLAKNTAFTLRIVTRFSNSSTLLKTPRIIEYKIKSNA